MKTILQKIWVAIAVLLGSFSAYAYDFDFEVDGIYYDVVSFTDLTCSVTYGTEKYSGEIAIPSEVNYKNRQLKVIHIGSEAFNDCSSLTSVTIPDSVTEIGSETFSRCSSLESIKLSNSLKSIEFGLFYGCESLKTLDIPGSIDYISQYDYHKSSNSSLTFSCGLTNFRILYSEEELEVGYSDTLNWEYVFRKCDWLSEWTGFIKTLYIDRPLAKRITVPNLEKLELGESIQTVQVSNINKLNKLATIESYVVVPPKLPEMSNSQYMDLNVFVPEEALEAYKADPVWGKFWNLQSLGVDGVKVDSKKEVIGRYDMNGRKVSADYQGLVIVRFSDGSCKKMLNR